MWRRCAGDAQRCGKAAARSKTETRSSGGRDAGILAEVRLRKEYESFSINVRPYADGIPQLQSARGILWLAAQIGFDTSSELNFHTNDSLELQYFALRHNKVNYVLSMYYNHARTMLEGDEVYAYGACSCLLICN